MNMTKDQIFTVSGYFFGKYRPDILHFIPVMIYHFLLELVEVIVRLLSLGHRLNMFGYTKVVGALPLMKDHQLKSSKMIWNNSQWNQFLKGRMKSRLVHLFNIKVIIQY